MLVQNVTISNLKYKSYTIHQRASIVLEVEFEPHWQLSSSEPYSIYL